MEPIIRAFISGLGLSASLIMAIGAQNIFVLRQGLCRQHTAWVVLICAGADAVLITAGVGGMGTFFSHIPMLRKILTYGGALFLGWYGVMALRRATKPYSMCIESMPSLTRHQVVMAAMGFTLLNPHVYLDTMLLVGTAGAAQPIAMRPFFVLGGVTASVGWFSLLGVGAQRLRSFFMHPSSWRLLEIVTGGMMLILSMSLLVS